MGAKGGKIMSTAANTAGKSPADPSMRVPEGSSFASIANSRNGSNFEAELKRRRKSSVNAASVGYGGNTKLG